MFPSHVIVLYAPITSAVSGPLPEIKGSYGELFSMLCSSTFAERIRSFGVTHWQFKKCDDALTVGDLLVKHNPVLSKPGEKVYD